MSIGPTIRRRIWLVATMVVIAGGTTWLAATAGPGTGLSFTTLQSPFTQDLYATSATVPPDGFSILGGVAFTPGGQVWSSECTFLGTRLHRFAIGTTPINGSSVHQEELVVDLTAAGPRGFDAGGCGLVNHPDGSMYSNSTAGIWRLNASTGAVIGGAFGHGGNALGIAVDRQGSHHLVYVGDDCHPSLPTAASTCTLWDVDPSNGMTQVFARLPRTEGTFLDGIYFDPSGDFIFAAHREFDFNTFEEHHSLAVIHRPAALLPEDALPDNSQLVQLVPMTSEPDGVAFHAAQGFVVTLNESDGGAGVGGTMTRFDFPSGDYTAVPTQTDFAHGGFRGDLLQVGADGCIYGTQGPLFQTGGTIGTRYDNTVETGEQSIFQICGGGGFVPPPGVAPPPPPQCTGVIGDFVWSDLNRNGLQDLNEPGLGNVTVTLKDAGGNVLATTSTSGTGGYQFGGLCAGSYTVEMTTPAGYDRTAVEVGADRALDSNSNPATVNLLTNTSVDNTIDFGLVNGFCEKQPVQTELNPNGTHFPGNKGPDAIVRVHKGESVQTAVEQSNDVNGDGYIIVGVVAVEGGLLGGHVNQGVVVSRTYPVPFALIGCSVTLHDPTPGDGAPTARVLTSAWAPPDGIGARIFVMDLHAEDSADAGWLVEGNNRYLRNVYGKHNATGVRFVGNSNTMHNGSVEQNTGSGLVIEGNSNTATDTNAFSNGAHGVWVAGNANQILKVDAGDKNKGNGGDGVHVEGAGNLVSEVDAFANGGDGIEVVAAAGTPNIVKKGVAGDKSGKGNAGNGILVSGPGNGTANPIELEQNTVKANGLVGIRITGSGHQLKNNVSGGTGSGETNVGCEFQAASGNVNATGNKANGVTVAGSNGSAFPTSCIGG